MNLYFYFVEWAIFTLSALSFVIYLHLFFKGSKYLTKRDLDESFIRTVSAKVTIIIPFRDATEELIRWLSSFEKVKFAEDAEVLLINDGSVNSLIKLRKRVHLYPNVRLIDRSHQGKKKAIEYGVSIASHDIILCTDADTVPEVHWVAGHLSCFSDQNVQMVCGRVAPLNGHWFGNIDFLALMAAGEVLIRKQRPVMCSGCNLAFRKEAFAAVNGYSGFHHFRSGDDVVLLHKIKTRFGSRAIAVNDFEASHVRTDMPETFMRLVNQRQRWGGKAIYYRDRFSLMLGVVVLICALMSYGLFVLVWPNPYLVSASAVLVGLKIAADASLISTYARVVGLHVPVRHLIWASALYPMYMGITFLRILVNPNPRW